MPLDDRLLSDQLYEASMDLAVAGFTLTEAADRIVVLALGRTTATEMALKRAESTSLASPASLVCRRAFTQLARAVLSQPPPASWRASR